MPCIALHVLRPDASGVTGLHAVFDAEGGSIGRAPSNRLVLPDPERSVSRVHALVRWYQGHFTIETCGVNPLRLNGRRLGDGQRVPIGPGDRLSLGGYELAVVDADLTAGWGPPGRLPGNGDPLGDLFGIQRVPVVGALSPPAPPSTPDNRDPFADLVAGPLPAAAPRQRGRPEAVWFAVTAPARASERFIAALAVHVESARAMAQQQLHRIGGPDSEPLLDLAPSSQAGWQVGAPVSVFLEVQGGRADPQMHSFEWNGRLHLSAFRVQPDAPAPANLELCFHVLLAGVPMGLVPLRVDLGAGNTAPSTVAQMAPSSAFASYASADAQEVGLCLSTLTRWAPSLEIFQDCLDLRPGEAFKPQLAQRIADAEAFLLFWSRQAAASPWVRWEMDTALRGKTLDALIPMPLEDPAIAPPPLELIDRHWRDRFMLARQGLAHVADRLQAADRNEGAALLAALREGLGGASLPIHALTPEVMRRIGQLLLAATRGTMDLLAALAMFRQQVGGEVLVIRARDNDPLKFAPSTEVALGLLLGPPVRGMVPPDCALREAFDELNAHQTCLLPAMQQALLGVLERFGADARLREQAAEDFRALLWQHCLRALVEAGGKADDPCSVKPPSTSVSTEA